MWTASNQSTQCFGQACLSGFKGRLRNNLVTPVKFLWGQHLTYEISTHHSTVPLVMLWPLMLEGWIIHGGIMMCM